MKNYFNNIKKYLINDSYFYFVVTISITFVIIKIPHLSLPFYWDEAFGHSVAARYMYENGLGILPSSLPSDISKGHPLLFFFFESLWMKLFGSSIIAMKSYPLLLSNLIIFSIYFFCKKFFNRFTAVVACLLFAAQEIFIAQSSFVLFEIQLTLLTLLSLYFFFSKRWLLYILFASMLVLTKESGLVLVITLLITYIFEIFANKNIKDDVQTIYKTITFLVISLFVIAIYFIIQKITYGWFFFPLHTKLMDLSLKNIYSGMFEFYGCRLFVYYGRNLMSVFLILSVIFIFIKHYKIDSLQKRVIIYLSIFIIFFITFSAVNFRSDRYILCLFPIYIILVAYLISFAFHKYKALMYVILILIFLNKVYFTYNKRSVYDSNLGFADNVYVHKQIIAYCEANNLYNKVFYAHFLMQTNMTNPNSGYLSDLQHVFKYVINDEKKFNKAEYFINTASEEDNNEFKLLKERYSFLLLKRFDKKKAWSELYKVEKK